MLLNIFVQSQKIRFVATDIWNLKIVLLIVYIKSEFTYLKRRRKWPILYNFQYYGASDWFKEYADFEVWHIVKVHAIAKLVNFTILIAIYKKAAGFIGKNFLDLDSACLNL